MSQQPDHHHDQHRTACQTKVGTVMNELAHDLRCHIRRSVRYHKARERFFDAWSNTFSFTSLLGGSAVVVSLLAQAPGWVALTSGAAVAVTQALEQVVRLGARAREHSAFAAQFAALERSLEIKSELAEDDIRVLRSEILMIETQEPPIKRYLDLICHNQVARSIGSDDVEVLTWWQRRFAQYLDGDSALQN